MEPIWIILALIAGSAGGYYARRVVLRGKQKTIEEKIEKDYADAKLREQELIVEAKEKALAIIEEAKAEESERRKELSEAQKRLNEKEERQLKREQALEKTEDELALQRKELEERTLTLSELEEKARTAIEEIAELTKDEARSQLFERIESDEAEAIFQRVKKLQEQGEEEIEVKAQKIISLAIDRFASSQVVDASVTYVDLPQEDMKGRIIGKEGRNIKALERLTGCEFIVDETPNKIMISGFSPVRRQVARRTLESLMKDGRIQPARIEEAVEEAKKNLAKDMRKAGEDALIELGIPVSSIDPKLVSILGRLKFRTSYGQNVLQHSIEVARISGMLAEELGADVFACKKGGLFHDIGKAVDHDMQGAHPEIGYQIMKKFGWPEELCYQSIAHHEDKPRTLEGVIVKAADAISGARPGARRNSVEEYLQRLQAIEDTANEFEGVDQAYAIQAGREVRVFVNPESMDDIKAYHLAVDLAKKIETTLTYPGEIKVTVIREKRIIEHAR